MYLMMVELIKTYQSARKPKKRDPKKTPEKKTD